MKQNIEQIIETFTEWYKSDMHSKNEDAYPELKTSEFLKGLDREKFIEYFLKFKSEGGKIQSGGARRATFFRKTLETNYAEFREFVLEPYGLNFNVYDWLEKVNKFPDFGKGSSTIFLNRIDKNRFAIVNNKSNEALKIMGYNIPNDFISEYHSIIDSQKDLIKKFPVIRNFYMADALNHFLIGTEEGKKFIPKLHTESNQVSEPKNDLRNEMTEATNSKRYWIYAPGENAKMWDEFNERGIMGLGWYELGDLNKYQTKEDIILELQKIEKTSSSKKNDANANWEFKNVIKKGDIIFVKKGVGELLGYGVVTSDYYFDNSQEYYQKCRQVEWKKKGSWKTSFNLPLKTLTDITIYPTEHPDFKFYYERLMAIIENGELSYNSMESLNLPQNLILYGPPGTGKTYELINKYINFFIDKNGEKTTKQRYEMITFHQSYSYEEFIEGIRPSFDDDDELKYKIEPGIFLQIAEKAREDKANPYAIFIDEINRGNISKIFGELITLIEPDKRQGAKHEIEVVLPYSKSKFSVPSNLYIIGTMNTADRSIALIDTALRRRFCFREMLPNTSLLSIDVDGINLQLLLSKMNERIEFLLDREHCLGHSFFMQVKSKKEICEVFKQKIIPLLQEYFYNDWGKLQLILGDNKSWGKKEEHKLVQVKKHYDLAAEKELFGSELDDFEDEIIYEINPELDYENSNMIPIESFIHIYQKPVKSIV